MASPLATATAARPVAALIQGPARRLQRPGAALARPGLRPRLAARPIKQGFTVKAASPEHEGAHGQASDLEALDWHSLSKLAAHKLASALAGQDQAVERLQTWLQGAAEETAKHAAGGTAHAAEAALGGGPSGEPADHPEGGKQAPSTIGRVARKAAQYLGVKVPEGGAERTLSDQAADYLGAGQAAVGSLKDWLHDPSSFKDSDTSKLVAALVHRLLQTYERETGEKIEGEKEGQFGGLYHLAQEVVGSGLTKDLVTALVKAYLKVPGGR